MSPPPTNCTTVSLLGTEEKLQLYLSKKMFQELEDNIYSLFFFGEQSFARSLNSFLGAGEIVQRFKCCNTLNVTHGNQACYIERKV